MGNVCGNFVGSLHTPFVILPCCLIANDAFDFAYNKLHSNSMLFLLSF